MEKVNLKILDFEDKKTKGNVRYTRFQTDDGWMSCFDKKVCETLKELPKDTEICLEITKSEPTEEGRVFSNIKGIGKLGEGKAPQEAEKSNSVAPTSKNGNNYAAMYVSYAKDIFCAIIADTNIQSVQGLHQDTMKNAIELVKQARVEFEK